MTSSKRRRLLAVMFTDVVGYTALMQRDEEACRIVRRRHRQVLEAVISTHGGDLLQYLGDGSLTMFPSVVDAVRAAIEVQRGLRKEPVVPLRIGIHQGDISYDTQGAYGDSVNVASRIESLGVAGSILLSAKAHDEIKNQPDILTTPLGEFDLKNVEESLEVYGIVSDVLTVPTRSDVLAEIRRAPTTSLNTTIRLNTALKGRYAIDRELGQGGMATVYLADDLKHSRKVALKVLKPELAAVVSAKRFLAEIKTTANLQHPNILPLFDSGEADGFLFYVMPNVEGESLRDRLDREHQLPVDEAVKITTDLAEALDYAHRHKVIHRDIKPANILMHEGRPLIADFGIALAVGAAGGGRLTKTGLSLGTPYYMSPEQATGERGRAWSWPALRAWDLPGAPLHGGWSTSSASAPSWPLRAGWRWPVRSPCSSKPAAGLMWPLFPPGATRPGILPRTERRQTDDESNGTGHGRARARPAVTASAGPHGAGAEHDLRAGGRRELSPTDPARRARRRLDRVRSGCVDPRTDRREPQQCRVI